ncbi:O-antigen/teichoic acid export membrane protein [Pseudomonas sp. SJZ078]|uniref:oligosaccharide flippase family protein n=1 Tax=Pseudomonas sp. SJZ078 TaxID=2572886 RepID=UPI0011AA99FB|nr:oligosaccharide flippase family protein [Pseudomonas sp. SJZ078]TWC33316.1 O-antigen/teichoic acid export membrane protein [Pseudomonas sp. SJZ078]
MSASFLGRIARVLMGTIGAQLITMGVMLLLVRLYTPADLGEFSVWLSFATIAAVAITGRYEMAIFNCNGAPDIQAILKLIFIIAVLSSLGIVGTAMLWDGVFYNLPPVISIFWVSLVAVIFGIGMNKVVLSLLTYQQAFNKLGISRISLAACIAVAQVIAAYFSQGVSGLIHGQVIGVITATGLSLLWINITWLRGSISSSWLSVKEMACRHKNFPKFSLTADLLNTAASQLPVIFIAARFGSEAAGWFALTLKMMGAPISLLAASVLDVFKEQAARDFRVQGNCYRIFLKTFFVLASLAIVPFGIFALVGEWIFGLLFGQEWVESGRYAVLLIPLFFMRFVVSPLSYTIYIAQKQKLDLLWQIGLLLFTWLCFTFSQEIDSALWSYSIGYAVMYMIYFWISYRAAKGESQ